MKHLKALIGTILTIAVLGLFIWYIHGHDLLLKELYKTSPAVILAILILYGISLLTIAAILSYSVKWCNHNINTKQNILLTMYSTIVNFFGPLQSGPGFRAIYLKAKLKVNLKSFISVTLFYYLILAWYSLIFLLIGGQQSQLGLLVIVVGLLMFLIALLLTRRIKWLKRLLFNNPLYLFKIALMTLVQTLILALIYFIELKTMNKTTSFSQAVSYTGAANFSLFVSFTPGAIGIREAFVLFAKHLSRLSSSTIIAASVLDRAVYFLYLFILFLLTTATHLKDRLNIKPTDA